MPDHHHTSPSADHTREALWRLEHPVLPLFRIIQFVYLTGPFARVEEIFDELSEPIETNTARYEDPPAFLEPYLPIMKQIEQFKNPDKEKARTMPMLVDREGKPANRFSVMESWVGQQLLVKELDGINSMLCWPYACVLCCVGPDYGGDGPGSEKRMNQDFFEIPLTRRETALFDLPKIDTEQTRSCSANSEPSLQVEGRPFFQGPAAIYNWQGGWTMILPRRSSCPQLDGRRRLCRVYEQRPAVCRKPPIFPYLLEKKQQDGKAAVHVVQNKLLAVWDCPYVQKFKEEIAGYAEVCGLEPVFMENKS
jgi:Fe-S-cluster containining protein